MLMAASTFTPEAASQAATQYPFKLATTQGSMKHGIPSLATPSLQRINDEIYFSHGIPSPSILTQCSFLLKLHGTAHCGTCNCPITVSTFCSSHIQHNAATQFPFLLLIKLHLPTSLLFNEIMSLPNHVNPTDDLCSQPNHLINQNDGTTREKKQCHAITSTI